MFSSICLLVGILPCLMASMTEMNFCTRDLVRSARKPGVKGGVQM